MRLSKSRRLRFLRRNSVIVPSSLLDASWLSDQSYFVKELFSTYLDFLSPLCRTTGTSPA